MDLIVILIDKSIMQPYWQHIHEQTFARTSPLGQHIKENDNLKKAI